MHYLIHAYSSNYDDLALQADCGIINFGFKCISESQTYITMYILMIRTLHFFLYSLECHKEVFFGHLFLIYIKDLTKL